VSVNSFPLDEVIHEEDENERKRKREKLVCLWARERECLLIIIECTKV
jgi:hypothetical protein